MKRLFSAITVLCLMATLFTIPVGATSVSEKELAVASVSAGEKVYLDDGYYYIDTITEYATDAMMTMAAAATYQKSGTIGRTIYNSDNKALFTLYVNGTFQYDKSTFVTCTASSYDHTIHVSSWRLTSGSSSRSGNSATAAGTFKRRYLLVDVEEIQATVHIYCDKNGNLSPS